MSRSSSGRLGSLFTACLLLLCSGCAGAPDTLGREELLVMVYSADHEPVLGAVLREGRRLLGRTDSFGRLLASGVKGGEHRFLCHASGFAPKAFLFNYQDTTQILYISLEPLGSVVGRLFRQGDSARLAALLALLEEANASREEEALVRALLLASRGEAGWKREVDSLRGELGEARIEALAGALQWGAQ